MEAQAAPEDVEKADQMEQVAPVIVETADEKATGETSEGEHHNSGKKSKDFNLDKEQNQPFESSLPSSQPAGPVQNGLKMIESSILYNPKKWPVSGPFIV